MRCELIDARGRAAAEVADSLRALVPAGASVREAVAKIVAGVRAGGDRALRAYVERFDTRGRPAPELVVEAAALQRAAGALDEDVRAGLELAIANVGRVAAAGVHEDRLVTFEDGHQVTLREAPVDRAAVYVPAGRAPYPSTVVMGVVCARAAGVGEVAVCAAPGLDGEVSPVILGACALAGADVVYRMGGAHAVAALAYGTETVGAVDVIVGPGNLYVQEAKQQVAGQVGIDGFAGPSDLLVVADGGADPDWIGADLLAQAEHGEASIVVGISPDAALLDALAPILADAPDTGAVARLVRVADVTAGLAVAHAFAPEHLQLIGAEAEARTGEMTHAGCVFVGATAATAFGDYVAGSNHVLPTGGAARFASSLSAGAFRRRYTEVRIGQAAARLAPGGAAIARAEGFTVHARSMQARIRDNGRP